MQAGTFTATVATTAGGNLELHLFTVQGNTLVDLGDSVAAPGATRALSAAVAAGQTILVEVKGHETTYGIMDQGTYSLTLTLA